MNAQTQPHTRTHTHAYSDPIGAQLQHGEVGQSPKVLDLGQLVLNEEDLLEAGHTLQVLDPRNVVEGEVQESVCAYVCVCTLYQYRVSYTLSELL